MTLIEAIRDASNAGHTVTFSTDWGYNSLTIEVNGSHTHVGLPVEDCTIDQLEEDTIQALTGGPGLNFVK